MVATTAVIHDVLRDHPDVITQLDAAHDAAWGAAPADVLELCRLRIAQLLGCATESMERTPASGIDEATIDELSRWPTSARFGARERACLAFCEQFVIDVATLSDAQAAGVTEHLGAQGFVDFVSALLVVEQRQRLRLGWATLFGEPGDTSAGAPTDTSAGASASVPTSNGTAPVPNGEEDHHGS